LKDRLLMERFLDSDRMALAYETADLVLSRCGATTLAELAIVGLPAILVPFPYSAEGHQEANARAIESAGGAVMILNSELTPESLENTIDDIVNTGRLETMASSMKTLAKPNAVKEIVQDIFNHNKLGGGYSRPSNNDN
jgi:UDP-N-acetylglucosamine--N-acetylmuramyl-(pentapeptide) pyrophosphoryl-undecaprenol N-acetylglucosamine transferase